VDGDAFLLLTDDIIKQLIPSLGLRSKFVAKRKQIQQCTMSGNVVSEGYPLAFRMLTAQAWCEMAICSWTSYMIGCLYFCLGCLYLCVCVC